MLASNEGVGAEKEHWIESLKLQSATVNADGAKDGAATVKRDSMAGSLGKTVLSRVAST